MSTKGPGEEFGDSDIINNTKQEQEGNTTKLEITLPSGRKFTSEKMNNDDLKASVLIGWCAAVRTQINADHAEKEIKRLKNKPAPDTVKEAIVEVAATADPEDYVRQQLELSIKRDAYAIDELASAKRCARDARSSLEKWKDIAERLGVSHDGVPTTDAARETESKE